MNNATDLAYMQPPVISRTSRQLLLSVALKGIGDRQLQLQLKLISFFYYMPFYFELPSPCIYHVYIS